MAKKPRAVILTSVDTTWLLPAWFKTVPAIKDQVEIIGLWVFPDKFGKREGSEVLRWYLHAFGLVDTAMLAMFVVLTRIRMLLRGWNSWEILAKQNGIPIRHGTDPNSAEVVDWIKANETDIIFSTNGFVFKKQILAAPRIGSINKHASLLPACKGLFPYIWAKLENMPLAMSFHVMTEKLDSGALLEQERLGEQEAKFGGSMVAFYIWVYGNFFRGMPKAIAALVENKPLAYPNVPASYFSIPEKNQVQSFKQRGYRIISLRDLFRGWPT